MSRTPSAPSRAITRWPAHALLLAAGGVACLVASPALAQQTNLRGAVAENEVNADLLGRPSPLAPRALAQASEPAPAYVPISAGAVADDEVETPESAGTLFPGTASETDAFAESASADAVRVPPGQARRASEAAADDPAATASADREPSVAEEELTTGTVRQGRVDSDDEDRNVRLETENARIEPIEGLDREREDNPYAPLGLRIGTFDVNATLDTGITWTSNANSSPDPEPAFLSESTLRLNAVSDWSRHSAIINAFGTYRRTISGAEITDPAAGIDATFNLDIREDLRGVARLGYALNRESADSAVVLPVTISRPLRHTLTGSLGLEKDVGKFRFGATGNVERLGYDDAELGGGGVLSQRDRNSTLVTGTLRAGYEISSALTPFAEVEYGRRVYELRLDSNGYARSADRSGARAGVELALSEKLLGEVSAGWINESFDDSRLGDVSGFSANADLAWSPERGTTVNFNASTTVEGTTTAGQSGSLLYLGSAALRRELRANLTLDAVLGASFRDYSGTSDNDLTLYGEAGLTWWLNRYVGLNGRYRYEQLTSTLPNRDQTTNSVYLGVKLQR